MAKKSKRHQAGEWEVLSLGNALLVRKPPKPRRRVHKKKPKRPVMLPPPRLPTFPNCSLTTVLYDSETNITTFQYDCTTAQDAAGHKWRIVQRTGDYAS